MFPVWKKKRPKAIVSDEALEARRKANQYHTDALILQTEAHTTVEELEEVNKQNHFIQSLAKVFGGTP